MTWVDAQKRRGLHTGDIGKLDEPQRAAAVVYFDVLPRNPNGKALKRELHDRFIDWDSAGNAPAVDHQRRSGHE